MGEPGGSCREGEDGVSQRSCMLIEVVKNFTMMNECPSSYGETFTNTSQDSPKIFATMLGRKSEVS